MNLDTAFCMDVGQVKTGDDREDTFVKMLQEVVRVTAPIAYGIASHYPSVQTLTKALKERGPLALEDIKVCIIFYFGTLVDTSHPLTPQRIEKRKQKRSGYGCEDRPGS